jgi:hypothetical protein
VKWPDLAELPAACGRETATTLVPEFTVTTCLGRIAPNLAEEACRSAESGRNSPRLAEDPRIAAISRGHAKCIAALTSSERSTRARTKGSVMKLTHLACLFAVGLSASASAAVAQGPVTTVLWNARFASLKGNLNCDYGDAHCNRCVNNVADQFNFMTGEKKHSVAMWNRRFVHGCRERRPLHHRQ